MSERFERHFKRLIEHAPKRIVPTLQTYRYITVAVALNLPGNAVIVGAAAVSHFLRASAGFSLPRYPAIIALAVLPVPLAVYQTEI